ncbi:hypothetical protein KPL71_024251 [Citrus sinensis]|uniref:Uncharacterized protein n=1 Tax=Citrus sinensis TaxID=2711 RepID=A0ACB8IQI6_CITSI|nr:hypothetical protein KPL71_024251 [Citrus sinensis]
MISAFSTQHKFQSKRDETLLLQTDLSKANTVIPKPIQWKDVNLPDEWILEGATAPVIPKQLEPNTELQNETQYSDDNNISYPFKESNPITVRKKTTEWTFSGSGRTLESEHPPLRSLTIDHGEPPVEIKTSPYKIYKDPETDLDSIIQQNNLCNANLNTIGKQLTRLENQFQQTTIAVSPIAKPATSKSDSDKKLKEPIFKPFQVLKTSQKFVQESKSDFAKAIREQLDRIEASSSSSSKVQIALDSAQSSKIGVLEQDSMSIASSDVEAFTEEPIPKANKIHWELALPTVKSPPDLAIDNRPSALNQSRFNASSVYEWNIDGMSEYNVLGLLQKMTMAANAYKTQSGTSDKAIAEILIAGFTGQLKGWWDHLLTKQQQLDILDSIQTDEDRAPILDEFNSPVQDAVATLIMTISLHFIGDHSHLRDKNVELLHNLRCKKLSEFQNYKTSFFTRLFLRDDANHITWKEKFIAESSDSESSMTGDSDPLQIDELIDSDTSVSSISDSDTKFYLKKINVLTKDQETFLELVKHISDPTLQREYLDKLLKTLEVEATIQTWLSSRGLLAPKIEDIKAQSSFLSQKSKAQSLLASAKTEEEYFKVMQQLLASRSEPSVTTASSDDEDEEEPFISLGDDNEDDCFGIFSPIKHCK